LPSNTWVGAEENGELAFAEWTDPRGPEQHVYPPDGITVAWRLPVFPMFGVPPSRNWKH